MRPDQEKDLAEVAVAFCKDRGWRFEKLAGHGVFKATYRVEDAKGQVLAVKVHLIGALEADRAVRELKALTELSKTGHVSMPTFLEHVNFLHKGQTFPVSVEEFLGGGTLTEAINSRGPLSAPDMIDLAVQLAGALTILHDQGLVHRDIKPDNVMFRLDGKAVLADFSIVRHLNEPSITDSALPQGPGSPFFASPEQLRNEKHLIDWRADQFGLGVSLSLAAYKQHPYARAGDTPVQVVTRVRARERPNPDLLRRAHSDGFGPLAMMVEPWPVARYRLPEELLLAWEAASLSLRFGGRGKATP